MLTLVHFENQKQKMPKSTTPKKGSDAALMIEYFATEDKLGDIAGMERVFTVWYPSIVPESHTKEGYYFDSQRKNYVRKALIKKGLEHLYQGWSELLESRHAGKSDAVSREEYDILKIQLSYLKEDVIRNQALLMENQQRLIQNQEAILKALESNETGTD